MTTWFILCASFGFVLTVCFAPSLLCLWKPHVYGGWEQVSLKYERRSCCRCLSAQHRKDPNWARVTAPRPNTAPTAETVELSSVRCGTGTTEIPRVSSGALSSMPVPPQVAGAGHAVMDHET